jgi:hypothetical protein
VQDNSSTRFQVREEEIKANNSGISGNTLIVGKRVSFEVRKGDDTAYNVRGEGVVLDVDNFFYVHSDGIGDEKGVI